MDISFSMSGMLFEYDEEKNRKNIAKHGISFEIAARVFLDYDRIKMYDDENSYNEDRFDTIGNIGAVLKEVTLGKAEDILFVVYTEREHRETGSVTRIISARQATNFERGLYYGKY